MQSIVLTNADATRCSYCKSCIFMLIISLMPLTDLIIDIIHHHPRSSSFSSSNNAHAPKTVILSANAHNKLNLISDAAHFSVDAWLYSGQ